MKQKNFSKKLVLNKKTIVHLDEDQLKRMRGGENTFPYTACDCYSADTNCPTRVGIACTT